ncbi:MAG: nucleotidyltransferase domain-containing protein [Defluviitaleaceae bacterium]|nr:nucleotidyltransferase domain-containing protein [Defluviitaleaceae bacterium]
MTTTNELITKMLPLLERYPVSKAALFGSYARKEQSEDSDLDILLEFSEPIGLRYGSLYLDLKEALPVAVGLLTTAGLEEQPENFRESVSRDMVVFYEK